MITYDLYDWDPNHEGSYATNLHAFLDRINLKKLGRYWVFEDWDDQMDFYVHEFDTNEEMLKYIEERGGEESGKLEIIERGTHAIFIKTW